MRVYQRIPQDGLEVICDRTLEGPNIICSGQQVYSLNGQHSNLNWSVSSNLVIDNISNGSITVHPISSTINGPEWVQVIDNQSCPENTFYKNVWLGKPSISNISISNLQDMGYGNYYKILPANGIYSYEGSLTPIVFDLAEPTSMTWSYFSGMPNRKIAYWASNGNTVDLGAKTTNAGEILKFTASNICGTIEPLFTFFTGSINPPPGPLVISPNPTDLQTVISLPFENTTENGSIESEATSTMVIPSIQVASINTITVFNSKGESVYVTQSHEKKVTIPTNSFIDGIYVVIVSDGKKMYRGNLVVRH